jgi:hypothetical protein
MLEALFIVLTLGSLEWILWYVHRKDEKEDRRLQRRQIRLLEQIAGKAKK